MRKITMLSALLGGLVLPGLAWADNTILSNAYSLMIGGTPAEATIPVAGSRWYVTRVVAGRSYCAETQGGVHFDTSATAGYVDTVLTVYGDSTGADIGSNDNVSSEPPGALLSRVCFVAALGEYVYLQVSGTSPAVSFNVRVRIVETTLFSNWFFVGGDYGAYTLLRNTTSSSMSYTVNWRNAAGAVIATTTGSLTANGGAFVNGRDFPAVVGATSGTVEVVHNGSPGAIVASTTVLSPTTGLSFDAPFAGIMGRQPW